MAAIVSHARPCTVCPALILSRLCYDRGDYADAGWWLRDAVVLFVDSLAASRGVAPSGDASIEARINRLHDTGIIESFGRKELIDMTRVGNAAARGDDLSVILPGYKVSLLQALDNAAMWLFTYMDGQPFCSHREWSADVRCEGRKGGAA